MVKVQQTNTRDAPRHFVATGDSRNWMVILDTRQNQKEGNSGERESRGDITKLTLTIHKARLYIESLHFIKLRVFVILTLYTLSRNLWIRIQHVFFMTEKYHGRTLARRKQFRHCLFRIECLQLPSSHPVFVGNEWQSYCYHHGGINPYTHLYTQMYTG